VAKLRRGIARFPYDSTASLFTSSSYTILLIYYKLYISQPLLIKKIYAGYNRHNIVCCASSVCNVE